MEKGCLLVGDVVEVTDQRARLNFAGNFNDEPIDKQVSFYFSQLEPNVNG